MKGMEDEEPKGVTIEDFVSEYKLNAFCVSYNPAPQEAPDVEVFNDARLRKYFQAYPRNIGDPLNWYLEELNRKGFTMKTSIQDEPAIFVRRKSDSQQQILLEDVFGNVDAGDAEDAV